MLIARLVFGLLAVASILCFAMFIGTRDPVWRRRGLLLVKWALVAGFGFFAVLMLERLTLLL